MRKTQYDTWGYKYHCILYEPCPLCYGCRAYDPSYKKCEHCEENSRRDICDKKKHTEKALTLMLKGK